MECGADLEYMVLETWKQAERRSADLQSRIAHVLPHAKATGGQGAPTLADGFEKHSASNSRFKDFWRDRLRTPVMVSTTVNVTGTLVCNLLFGTPIDLRVGAVFEVLGILIGSTLVPTVDSLLEKCRADRASK